MESLPGALRELVEGRSLVLALLLAASPAISATQPEEVRIQIRREAVLSVLQAAMPYTLAVGAGPLSENLVFSEPTTLRFEEGRIAFAVRCQGSPIPLDQVLHPVFTFRREAAGYQLVLESLPVGVPGFGRVDLKDLFPPVDLQTLLRQGVVLSGRPTILEVRVERILVLRDVIELSARLRLTPIASR